MNFSRFILVPAVVGFMGVAGAAAAQCAGSGVVTRIQGLPTDVTIARAGKPVSRPRVLEVLCSGDTVTVKGSTVVTLSIDGVGAVKVDKARAYSVGPRKGKPGAVGNVYRAVSEEVMPDMKRLPWDVRTKGEGDPLHFTAPSKGVQTISPGRSQLAIRLVGPTGPYRVQLLDASGAVVKSAESAEAEMVLTGLSLTPGEYRLTATDGTGDATEMKINVGPGRPAPSQEVADLSDPELAAALHALEIAKADPNKWSFEAQQLIASAPENGLDRERVYQLIETYGDF